MSIQDDFFKAFEALEGKPEQENLIKYSFWVQSKLDKIADLESLVRTYTKELVKRSTPFEIGDGTRTEK